MKLDLPDEVFAARPALREMDGAGLIVGFRPEDLEDAAMVDGAPAGRRFPARVALTEALGSDIIVHLALDATPVDAGDPDAVEEIGDEVVAVGRFNPRSRVRRDADVDVVVDVENLHFFAADSKTAIWD